MEKAVVKEDVARVEQILLQVLGTNEYTELARMGGLTNHTYKVTLTDGQAYVVRIPGEGTEEMIDRASERKSTQLACSLGIDAPLLYFGPDGSKLTQFIPNALTMSAELLQDEHRIAQMAQLLQILHSCGQATGVPFEVFAMAESYEKIIADKKVPMFEDYVDIKNRVMQIKSEIDAALPVCKVPCHNDPLCENWVVGDDRMYLIDWEYAGMNDGMWDVADVAIEAGFDAAHDSMLLSAYLGRQPDIIDEKHFLASKIYVDYLWTLWAKARVPYDGQPMEDWAAERYARLKNFLIQYQAL